MKNKIAEATPVAAVAETPVHFMKKSHMLISSKHIDLDNLSALEAGAMSLALLLAVIVGTVQGTMWS